MKKNSQAKKPKATADSDHHEQLARTAQEALDGSAVNTPQYVKSDATEEKSQ